MPVKNKSNRKKIVHILLIILMLSMILSRLTWLQLRETSSTLNLSAQLSLNSIQNSQISEKYKGKFPNIPTEVPEQVVKWFESPGFISAALMTCLSTQSFIDLFTKYQILCLFWIVILNIMLTRILTGSWLLALLVGTVLFSRGVFLSRIDAISQELIASFLISLWFVFSVCFVQTKSQFYLNISLVVVLLLTFFHASALLLPLILLLCLQQERTSDISFNSQKTVNFWTNILDYHSAKHILFERNQGRSSKDRSLWYRSYHPLSSAELKLTSRKLLLSILALSMVSLILFKLRDTSPEPLKNISFQTFELLHSIKWYGQFAPHMDAHFLLSCLILLMAMFGSNNSGFSNLKTCARILVLSFCFLFLSYLVESAFSYEILSNFSTAYTSLWLREQHTSENPLIWFESNILTFGIIGFVHLLIRIQSQFQKYKISLMTINTDSI